MKESKNLTENADSSNRFKPTTDLVLVQTTEANIH